MPKNSNSSGGKNNSGGSKSGNVPNLPSTTNNPSGKGRGNNPPSGK